MPTKDLARVLRDYALEPLRQELRAAGARVLVIEDARGVAELARTEASFDAVWAQLDGLAGIDVPALADGVARALRPGGRLVCVVPGAWPLHGLIARALLGRGEAPGALRGRIEGGGAATCAGFAEWRRAFRPTVAWRRSRAIGVLVPPAESWRHFPPLALGLLASAEDVLGAWPLVRTLGRFTVHEGVRR